MIKNRNLAEIRQQGIKSHEIAGFLARQPFKYFQQFNLVPKYKITEYYEREIYRLLTFKSSVFAAAVRKKDILLGLAILEKLPWETEYFKIGMGKISYFLSRSHPSAEQYKAKSKLFRKLFKLSQKNYIKNICFETDAGDLVAVHAAEDNGFKLISTQFIYLRNKENLTGHGKLGKSYIIRPFKKEDIRQVLKIASQSKAISRFHANERLPREKINSYYKIKTRNCCLGKIADGIFVLEKDKHVIGFYIFRNDCKIGHFYIGYVVSVALASEAQGKGIGTAFMEKVDKMLLDKFDFLIGKVHIANIPMIKAMNKANAEFVYAMHTFHKWL